MYLLIEILKERAPLISFPTDQISGEFVAHNTLKSFLIRFG